MKKTIIFTVAAAAVMLASCGKDTSSSKEKIIVSDKHSSSSSSKEEIKMIDVANWATKDIWNDGFCNIYHYVEDGKDATGRDMDINFTIDNLKIAMEKKDEYDTFIHSLDDGVSEQAQLINAWDKMMEQADSLYQKAISETPRPSDETYEFNTDLFKQYFDTFYSLALEIRNPTFK